MTTTDVSEPETGLLSRYTQLMSSTHPKDHLRALAKFVYADPAERDKEPLLNYAQATDFQKFRPMLANFHSFRTISYDRKIINLQDLNYHGKDPKSNYQKLAIAVLSVFATLDEVIQRPEIIKFI